MDIFDYIEKKSKQLAQKIGKGETKEEIEIYEYAIFAIFSQIFTNGIGLIIAALLGIFLPYVICIGCYMVLRMFAGGYHCNSFKQCFFISNILYLVLTFLATRVQNPIVVLITAIIGGIFIIPMCPKPSEYSVSRGKIRDKTFRDKYIIALAISVMFAVIFLIFNLPVLANSISAAIIGVVFVICDGLENIIGIVKDLFNNE